MTGHVVREPFSLSEGHGPQGMRVALFGQSHQTGPRPSLWRSKGAGSSSTPRTFAAVADKGLFLALFAVGVVFLALFAFVTEFFRSSLPLTP